MLTLGITEEKLEVLKDTKFLSIPLHKNLASTLCIGQSVKLTMEDYSESGTITEITTEVLILEIEKTSLDAFNYIIKLGGASPPTIEYYEAVGNSGDCQAW